MSTTHEQIQLDLEEFASKGLPDESWDVYLARRALERWLESEAGQGGNK